VIREALKTMANDLRKDDVASVLDRMEHYERTKRLAIIAAAAVEAALLAVALVKVNWRDDTQLLLFIFAVLGYTIIVLGLVAVGAHVSRVGARVVAALDRPYGRS
jgi:hypothetical protein